MVILHANYKSWFVAISKNRTARYVLRIVLQSRDEFALLHSSSLICLFCNQCMCACVCVSRVFFAYTYILPYYTESARFSPIFKSRLRQQPSDIETHRHSVTDSRTRNIFILPYHRMVLDKKETRRMNNQLANRAINFFRCGATKCRTTYCTRKRRF